MLSSFMIQTRFQTAIISWALKQIREVSIEHNVNVKNAVLEISL